jgi:hypothetical protein
MVRATSGFSRRWRALGGYDARANPKAHPAHARVQIPRLPTASAPMPTTGEMGRPFNTIWQNSKRNEGAGVVSRRRKEDLAAFFQKRSTFLFRGFDPKQ